MVEVSNADALKKLCFELKNGISNYVVVLAANIDGKASVALLSMIILPGQKTWKPKKLLKNM